MVIYRKRIQGIAIWLMAAVMMSVIACTYNDVLPVVPDPGIQVKFSEDVVPIFNASCNLAGCHNGVGHAPDLRSNAAYESLWGGGYIDTMLPEQSELVLWMSGQRGLPMPIEGVNATYTSTVLQWIKQGAQNN